MTRYAITSADLAQKALILQVGSGIADRVSSADVGVFITEAEDWAEGEIEEFIGVPLKAITAPGASEIPTTATNRNYPIEFIQAVMYRALGLLLISEFFENAPNTSEAGQNSLSIAERHIEEFKTRRTVRVGAGRLRQPNPHMPPMVAPRPSKSKPFVYDNDRDQKTDF